MTSKIVLFVAVATFAAASVPGRAASQSTCPDATPRGQRVVQRLLVGAEYAETRQRYGIPAASSSTIRKLSDWSDAAACQRLRGVLTSLNSTGTAPPAGWQPTFYIANGQYVIVVASTEPAVEQTATGMKIRMRWTPVYVLSSSFALVAGVAM